MATNLYVTTSRKPAQLTRRVARTLARLLGATYENRGKGSVNEVGTRAAQLGLSRVLFVYESHGNPARLAFWEDGWLPEEFAISGVREPSEKPSRRSPDHVVLSALDEEGNQLGRLFNISGNDEGGRAVELRAGKATLRFTLDGQEVLALIGVLRKGTLPE